MDSVAVAGGRGVAPFQADETKTRQAIYDVAIKRAVRLRDWAAVERAIASQVAEQFEFVAWWDKHVGVRQSPGRGGSKSRADRGAISADAAESATGISHQQVSKWRKRQKDAEGYIAQLVAAAMKKAMEEVHNHRAQGTGENEWYTPAMHIEAAREVLGAIDLDPATSALANDTVKAAECFTESEDGLSHEWHGRVWMNPPYSQPHIMRFVEKLVAEHESGRVTEAIALMHNYTDTAWFHLAANAAAAICFTRGRVAFEAPDGSKAAPTQGQAFFYFGDRVDDFSARFRDFGFVVLPA